MYNGTLLLNINMVIITTDYMPYKRGGLVGMSLKRTTQAIETNWQFWTKISMESQNCFDYIEYY